MSNNSPPIPQPPDWRGDDDGDPASPSTDLQPATPQNLEPQQGC